MFKPPYWFHDNVKFSNDDIKKLKNSLLDDKYNNKDIEEHKTSFFYNLENRPDAPDAFLNIYYKNIIDDITKKIGVYHLSRYDYYYWSQLYQINGYHKPHNHSTGKVVNDISWVHFLDVPEQKCFRFTDTKGNILIPDEQSNGDIICFPSWVWHEVVPLRTDYLRLVIAGNIHFTSHDDLS